MGWGGLDADVVWYGMVWEWRRRCSLSAVRSMGRGVGSLNTSRLWTEARDAWPGRRAGGGRGVGCLV